MRQRITFLHKPHDPVDPSTLRIAGAVLSGPEHPTARQDRLTFSVDELPADLRALVTACQELQVRWASFEGSEAVSPLLSRLPPGLHVFYAPVAVGVDDKAKQSPLLCDWVKRAFGELPCSTPHESFIALPRAPDSTEVGEYYQYYQPLAHLRHFIRHATPDLCPTGELPCVARMESLDQAVALDISYDGVSQKLTVTAQWPRQLRPILATSEPHGRTEVGFLAEDRPPHLVAHELGISGHLVVLGQDDEPRPVLFSIPSRHRGWPSDVAKFSARFLQPAGLHPNLEIRMEGEEPPASAGPEQCRPYAYFTLPRSIFADKYQFADNLFLASRNLTHLLYISQPVDLEAPEYGMGSLWGSTLLVGLAPPSTTADEDNDNQDHQAWTAQIPLHWRYHAPTAGGGRYTAIDIPYPAVFWACETGPAPVFGNNPFDRTHLGYDGLFAPQTAFWHVHPTGRGEDGQLVNTVRVPVLDTDEAGWVGAGTAMVIVAGFSWVVWKLWRGYVASGYQATHAHAHARTDDGGDRMTKKTQ